MNIAKMMKQAQQMQGKMQKVQAELAEQEVEASVGGGKVTVTATCSGDVRSIKIDPQIIDPADSEILEDLILSGVTQAIEQGRKVMEEEMSKITGGLGMGGGGLPGGLM
ncbi:YbaB/EbfC family nucleoid-associated protein [Verrucomicrobiales bacterium]|nr:YbaB/EbfC family nucleoid-associated protein [Verrucomicrobiales bacterium]MDC0049263.1 YbaB/EbfC family nucleoid-associated protein [Verrucomicrobiota bacterium]NCG27930.1 YbaB/EbfC family nucleoid-associated protein [Verrucomicrobiales bacterium]